MSEPTNTPEELGSAASQDTPEWTPEQLQALEAADALDPGDCTTCPACGCPGMN